MTTRSSPPASTRHQLRRDLAWCFGLLTALLLWDLSHLDLSVMRQLADPAGFVWRDHWLTTVVLHQGGRAVGWAVFACLVGQLWRPLTFARDVPLTVRRWWLATCVLCLLVIPLVKQASLTSCPWSLVEFGGNARYVSHWALGVSDGGGGGCFPSGHASAAFAFLAGYFALRERHPVAARRWLAGVVGLGLVFGLGQTLRGAHYPSHTLWTAWICLALTLASHHGWRAWRRA
jgi:membrane-associated PAP2 superfamily phosphatase